MTPIQTWHWRFCVLHDHALVVHEGKDAPGPSQIVRSAIALKDVLSVGPEFKENNGRPFCFSLLTEARTWVFCTMNEADCMQWISHIQASQHDAITSDRSSQPVVANQS